VRIPVGPPGGPGDTPGDPPGDFPPPLSCDSEACRSALAEVVINRNRVLSKCAQVAATRSRMNLMAAIAAFFFGLFTALIAAAAVASATIFGIPLGIVLFWAAVSALATAILFGIFAAIGASQLAVQQGELNAERQRFTNTTSAVTANCPASCWGDLSLPACSE
jgi:hypothetical protein